MKLDLVPLLESRRGDGVTIAGVRPGEDAHALRALVWTSGEENFAGRRRFDGDRVFYVKADGTEQESLLADRIEAVFASGGCVRNAGLAVYVEDGRLLRMFLRDAQLAAFPLHREEDVTARFGAPEGIERASGQVVFHYPSRSFAIGWSARNARLDYVMIGRDDWREPQLGARDLMLQLVTSWDALEPHAWAEPPSDGQAAHVRFKRIEALSRALEVGSVLDLVRGDFIDRRPSSLYREIASALAARSGIAARSAEHSFGPSLMRFVYLGLLRYRVNAERLLAHNSGVQEAGFPEVIGTILATEDVNDQLAASLGEIESWLASLIDPTARVLLVSELAARFGYPDVDLEWIEEDLA